MIVPAPPPPINSNAIKTPTPVFQEPPDDVASAAPAAPDGAPVLDSSFTGRYFFLGIMVPEFKSTSNLNILLCVVTRLAHLARPVSSEPTLSAPLGDGLWE